MIALPSLVLSGSVETAACKFSTTSSKFWLIYGRTSLILVVGASGMVMGAAGQDSVYNNHLDIVTRNPAWNPAIVGEDLIVSQILFAEAMSNVVHCSWAVPDYPRASIEMTFLFWARACGTWDGRSSIILQGWSVLLRGRCKGNLTDLRRILHLSLAKGNPK
jgi:hypothetical protein